MDYDFELASNSKIQHGAAGFSVFLNVFLNLWTFLQCKAKAMFVCVCLCDAGICGRRNSICLHRVLSTPATTHTHTSHCWHTHVTTATRYSPRHATDREAETTILEGLSFSTWGRRQLPGSRISGRNIGCEFSKRYSPRAATKLGFWEISAKTQDGKDEILCTVSPLSTHVGQVHGFSVAFHTCGSHCCWFDLTADLRAERPSSKWLWVCVSGGMGVGRGGIWHEQIAQIYKMMRTHLLICSSGQTNKGSNIFVYLYGKWNEFHGPLARETYSAQNNRGAGGLDSAR